MGHDASTRLEEHRAWKDEERVAARFPHCGKRSLQVFRAPRINELDLHSQCPGRDFGLLPHASSRVFPEHARLPEDGHPFDSRGHRLEQVQAFGD